MLPLSRLPQAGEAALGAQEQQQSLGTVGDQGMLRPRGLDMFFLQVRMCPQGPPSPARGRCGALNATKILVCWEGERQVSVGGFFRGKTDLGSCLKITGTKQFHHQDENPFTTGIKSLHHWDRTHPSPAQSGINPSLTSRSGLCQSLC